MDRVSVMDTAESTPGSVAYEDLPGEHVTIDQIVALNLRHWRRAAGMTQEELGERIGWSAANVSAAERSAENGRDKRRFDAHTIVSAALALGVPIVALFLPPPDDGVRQRYLFHNRDLDADCLTMTDLMYMALPDSREDTPVMDGYRKRFEGDVTTYLDPTYGEQVAQFMRDATDAEMRASRARRLRMRQAELRGIADRVANELGEIAAALEQPADDERMRELARESV